MWFKDVQNGLNWGKLSGSSLFNTDVKSEWIFSWPANLFNSCKNSLLRHNDVALKKIKKSSSFFMEVFKSTTFSVQSYYKLLKR